MVQDWPNTEYINANRENQLVAVIKNKSFSITEHRSHIPDTIQPWRESFQ